LAAVIEVGVGELRVDPVTIGHALIGVGRPDIKGVTVMPTVSIGAHICVGSVFEVSATSGQEAAEPCELRARHTRSLPRGL
jgi:hypothetical protein